MDANHGIMRFPLDRMVGCPTAVVSSTDVIQFESRRYFAMKACNVIGPYDTIQSKDGDPPYLFQFRFLHSSPNRFLSYVEVCF